MSFTYTLESRQSLTVYLTPERLTAYLVKTSGNISEAIALYERNCLLSQSLYGVVQTFEVALRNSIHSTLSTGLSDTDWFDIPNLLNYKEARTIGDAKINLQRWGKRISPGTVIAELTFGFWVRLHAPEYEKTFWVPHMHKAFPMLARPSRRAVFDRLESIRRLRNRVAHYEPVFKRALSIDYASINEALYWINPTTAAWMDSTNTLMRLL